MEKIYGVEESQILRYFWIFSNKYFNFISFRWWAKKGGYYKKYIFTLSIEANKFNFVLRGIEDIEFAHLISDTFFLVYIIYIWYISCVSEGKRSTIWVVNRNDGCRLIVKYFWIKKKISVLCLLLKCLDVIMILISDKMMTGLMTNRITFSCLRNSYWLRICNCYLLHIIRFVYGSEFSGQGE